MLLEEILGSQGRHRMEAAQERRGTALCMCPASVRQSSVNRDQVLGPVRMKRVVANPLATASYDLSESSTDQLRVSDE